MSYSPYEELVRNLLKTKSQLEGKLSELKSIAKEIHTKYEPRQEFQRWRDSQEGQTWKCKRYRKQKQRCAICQQPIQLKGSHIDHIKPISTYPNLALNTQNMQITCPDCNLSKNKRCDVY